ncbi:uncharacterized protein LOC131327177 [Rhododendron vialii]|uniref:uncharacterized protein LOC131327177 n=1 Tax=Rhododendron vialii TaxID=182163 RepID=UPI00266028C6|nr:uncharacterized protein LOC131327177 [Rhododendron vialii]
MATAFTWYINLPPNSIQTWVQLEKMFHQQFYRCKIPLPKAEYVRLALNGLDFEFKKKYHGIEFRDLFELSVKASRYEKLLEEEKDRKAASKGTYYQDPNYDVATVEIEASVDVDVAEIVNRKPYLLADKLLKLPFGHKIPALDELKGKEYCKYHNSWSHSTNNCFVFRNDIQDKIDRGEFKFPEKDKQAMRVDGNPFPSGLSANMVSVNMRSMPRTAPRPKVSLGAPSRVAFKP